MNRFDLDQLHALLVVAATGSFSAAAPALFRSQSAVSEQIRKLEELCGTALFVRSKQGARLTTAGARLQAHAEKILSLNNFAVQDMRGLSLSGDLRLAITDYFRPTRILGLLKRLGEQYPHLRLHVSIRKSAEIEQLAEADEFDLGIAMRVLDPPQSASKHQPLHREALHWVAAAGYRLPASGVVPLVVLPADCALQRYALKRLEHSGVTFNLAHSASGIAGLQMAVAAGLGVSCVNASAIGDGIEPLRSGAGLPHLPEVEFSLVAPRADERALIAQVRDILIKELLAG
ncbi:LysR family transcriptional regulator [Pseudomonas sp. 2835]|uniref:LysR family transcriptional regulator n=1 Tax=Pseudomonas sp. 2835 TaxID=3156451 RepID=UPI003D232B9F